MGALVRDTFRAMVVSVESQFDESELVLSQWLTLKLVATGRIECIGDVNRELGLESGASTRLVDQLQKRGWLTRKRSPVDRRVVTLRLTQQGRALIEIVRPRLLRFWETQLSSFSPEEAEQLFALLSRLQVGLGG